MSRYVGLGLVAVMLLVSGCVVDPLSYGGGYPSYGGSGGSGYPYTTYNNQTPYYGGTAYPYSNPYYYYGNNQYPTNPSNPGSVVYNHRQQVKTWVQNRRGVVQNPNGNVVVNPNSQGVRAQQARQAWARRQAGGNVNPNVYRQVNPNVNRQVNPNVYRAVQQRRGQNPGGVQGMIAK
jgi:hypothetical protein